MARKTERITAAWRPGWYALDQALAVGRTAQFAFFPPPTAPGTEPLIFYNALWKPEDAVAGWGTVVRITHPELGAILEVELKGLDYTFVLVDGRRLIVDAEEEPGQLFGQSGEGWRVTPSIESWDLLVEIADLTPLQPAPPRLEGQ